MTTLLTERRQILLKLKTTPGAIDGSLVDAANLMPVLGEVGYTPDVAAYVRKRGGLDPVPLRPQKASRSATVTFTMECRAPASGGVAPQFGTPLRACRYSQTLATGTAAVGAVVRNPAYSIGTVSPTVTGTFTGTKSGVLVIEVTGVTTNTSATFQATFYPGDGTARASASFTQSAAGAVSITSVAAGLSVDFGDPSTSTTGIAVGDQFTAALTSDQQISVAYQPISKQDRWADICFLQDGRPFYIKNASGTFSFSTNRADGILMIEFTFTGVMITPVDQNDVAVALLSGAYNPTTFISTGLTADNAGSVTFTCISEISLDGGGTVSPVQCLQEPEGFDSFEVTAQEPVITFDPAATLFGDNATVFDNWYALLAGNDVTPVELAFPGTNSRTLTIYALISVTGVTPSDRDGQVADSVTGAVVVDESGALPLAPWTLTIT